MAVFLVTIALAGVFCFFVFRDTCSLVYWRIRYFRLPRATGTGPREILAKTVNGITVSLVGISEKEWQVSRKWVPANQTAFISTNCLLATLGCWWDDSWSVTAAPTDSNGHFSKSAPRIVKLDDAPLQTQVSHQSPVAIGEHLITPQPIGGRGDGFFVVLKIEGIDAESPIRASGQARLSHPLVGANDPDSIQSISVSTKGSDAVVGDLAVAIFTVDACDNPDIKIDLPSGWTSIGANSVAIQNIGYRACCRLVTEAGPQAATCRWNDRSSFAAEATLVIFKAAKMPNLPASDTVSSPSLK
jgi:hypothetical protein